MTAEQRRIYAAMMESLATSFSRAAAGQSFIMSFNAADVADMLRDCAKEIAPGPRQVGFECPHCGAPKKTASGLCPNCHRFSNPTN